MLVDVYNLQGEKTGQTRLPKEIFGLEMNSDLVHQVVVSQMSNRRQGTVQTKDRGDVSGGGKKPWRQKGTGRARHGSNRSPIWKGGGVTFGPQKEKNYQKTIPVKMRKKALLMVLSEKAKNGMLVVMEELKAEKGKTKEIFNILKKMPCFKKSILIALPENDKKIVLASRNIPKTKTMEARELNALDALNHQYLIIPKESIKVMEKVLLK